MSRSTEEGVVEHCAHTCRNVLRESILRSDVSQVSGNSDRKEAANIQINAHDAVGLARP